MLINPKEKRDLKKSYKRLAIFLLIAFIFDSFIAFLFFSYTNMHEALCGFIIIVITAILYLLFLFICAKIDKKKAERLARDNKKDPFSKEQ